MKWLSAGLTFVNLSTISGLLLGMAGNGLNPNRAVLSLIVGAAFALAAYLGISDTELQRPENGARKPGSSPATRYRQLWFWLMAACFALFALRSFCWLLYIDGDQLRIQSPNNLGDLALHITFIRNFTNGVALWPNNPIYVFSKLRYPAGIDLFNSLLCLVHVDLAQGLIWTGLMASLATFYAFFRWAGTFGVAGFLFNGGIAGFQFLGTLKFLDYQGGKAIAWKSIPLSMFLTQRGLLYAIPAGLLLLWHWREKFFCGDVQDRRRGALPFWVELSLYASMPLFHVHTFLALSIVLFFLFIFESLQPLKFIIDLVHEEGGEGMRRLILAPTKWGRILGDTRMHTLAVVAGALLPATFFVWLTTDHFHAKSVLEWHPGWLQNSDDFAAPFFQIGNVHFSASSPVFGLVLQKTWNGIIAPVFQFWLMNFGEWMPLILALIGLCGWRAWKGGWRWSNSSSEDIAFLSPAVVIFLVGFLVKTAPWDWDNLKLMMWSYFLVLPFLWKDLIARWALPVRVSVCVALFGSGFVSLFGGLAAGRPGFGFVDRGELDAVGVAVRHLPVEARFAAYPIYNHPLLLQGRKVVLGYPGHLWTEGFDYKNAEDKLLALMQGVGDWRAMARALHVRYIFWGREEKTKYTASKRPWEGVAPPVASGQWGAIYDLEPTLGSQ